MRQVWISQRGGAEALEAQEATTLESHADDTQIACIQEWKDFGEIQLKPDGA